MSIDFICPSATDAKGNSRDASWYWFNTARDLEAIEAEQDRAMQIV